MLPVLGVGKIKKRVGGNSPLPLSLSYMALVVRCVKVLAIPTRGEVHFRSELLAIAKGKPSVLSAVSSINAHDGDGFLCEIRIVLCSTRQYENT
jgi:hypothetical protein